VDEEASQSVSVTPATVNQRPVSRPGLPASRLAAPDEEDDYFPTDSGLSTVEHTDPTPTLRPDPDDDETTVGYDNYASDSDSGEMYAPTNASLPRRRFPVALLVAGGGALLLALGAAVVWSLRAPAAEVPQQDLSVSALQQPPAVTPPGVAPAPPAEPPPAVGTPAPDADATRVKTALVEDAGTGTTAPTSGDAAEPEPTADTADAGIAAPARVDVRFEAPARTVLKQEGGERLPVNKVVPLAPGPIRVRYTCPGRRAPKGTKPYLIEPAGEGPLVLQIPCRSRR
jgi:hypothetical protein